jgi:PRTRC genetic system ThiF family protein
MRKRLDGVHRKIKAGRVCSSDAVLPVMPMHYEELAIYVIGTGGTGSYMANNVASLARRLIDGGKRVRLTLVDPDRVEPKNLTRQNFAEQQLGRPKVEATAELISGRYRLEVTAVPEPFTSKMISSTYGQMVILVGCVDNFRARQAIAEALHDLNHYLPQARRDRQLPSRPMAWWLDSGNSEDAGQVSIGCVPEVRDLKFAFGMETFCSLLPSPGLLLPDLLQPPPPPPVVDPTAGLSCAELTQIGRQSDTINRMMADCAYSFLDQFLAGTLRTFATYYDDRLHNMFGQVITRETLARTLKRPVSFFESLLDDPVRPAADRDEEAEEEDEAEEAIPADNLVEGELDEEHAIA